MRKQSFRFRNCNALQEHSAIGLCTSRVFTWKDGCRLLVGHSAFSIHGFPRALTQASLESRLELYERKEGSLPAIISQVNRGR